LPTNADEGNVKMRPRRAVFTSPHPTIPVVPLTI
jgi:hypothetical protein